MDIKKRMEELQNIYINGYMMKFEKHIDNKLKSKLWNTDLDNFNISIILGEAPKNWEKLANKDEEIEIDRNNINLGKQRVLSKLSEEWNIQYRYEFDNDNSFYLFETNNISYGRYGYFVAHLTLKRAEKSVAYG